MPAVQLGDAEVTLTSSKAFVKVNPNINEVCLSITESGVVACRVLPPLKFVTQQHANQSLQCASLPEFERNGSVSTF